jgi:WD40 repeat protein
VLHGHVSNVFSVKFLPGSGDQRLVTGGNDGSCRLYDVDTETQLSFMAHHSRKVAAHHNNTARF